MTAAHTGTTAVSTAKDFRPDAVILDGRGFEVRDDGPGFPPEPLGPDAVSQPLERFARGDAARNREGGVGLGLALVQAIVAAHGGTVSLDSAPGNTRILVRLR